MAELPSVLVVHTRYLEPGGEDRVAEAEAALLEARGHRVLRHERSNEDFVALGALGQARATLWNAAAARELRALVERERPDVVHFHNTFPLLSPAAYGAARSSGAAVVQTLHNYRLICPGSTLLRDGQPCELCVGRKVAWPAVAHRCYRGSAVASAATTLMNAAHGARGTWRREVDAFIALHAFARERFLAGGLPAQRVHVKPNFLAADPGEGPHGGGVALFVGRLTEDKGVRVLLEAWRAGAPGLPLRIVGDGPLRAEVETAAASGAAVEWLGQRAREEVLEQMRRARMLVVPSLWYEGFPMVVVEALACGLPVVASRRGGLAEILEDGEAGVLFSPGDAAELATAAHRLATDDALAHALSRTGRQRFLTRYSADANYERLMEIYRSARRHRSGHPADAPLEAHEA